MSEGGASSPGVADDILAIFDGSEPGEPYTTTELATAIDSPRPTVGRELHHLAEREIIETKSFDEETLSVWWRPDRTDESLGVTRSLDSDHEQSYEELLASERQFRAVFDKAFDSILIADDEAQYVDANPAACDLFGLPKDELLGRTIQEFTAEGYDFDEAWRDFQESTLDRGLFPLVNAEGEQRLVEFAATPNILPGRHLSVLRDVTERREAKSKLAAERERSKQYQQTLIADSIIELVFELHDSNVFDELSKLVTSRVEFEGVVPTSDGRLLHYLTVDGAVSSATESAVSTLPQVDECRTIFRTDESVLLELDLNQSPIYTLVNAGTIPKSLQSEAGLTTVVAEAGTDIDLQSVIKTFTEEYPSATIVTKRTLNRPIMTTRQYRDSLANRLTERQTEALRAAYLAGYYEWPRKSTSEEIASSMGIAASTWLRHLRLAESKLVNWFFEELEA